MRTTLAAAVAAALCLAPRPAPAADGSAPAPAVDLAGAFGRLLLQPDLSAVASFAAAWNGYDVATLSPRSGPYAPEDQLQFLFQELELGLKAAIDPYARAEIYIAFSPEEVAVEEAFLTTLSLPAGLQLKAGRFFSPFGRRNGQHPHAWDFVDGPLAHGRVLAGEVLAGPGVDLAWLAPVPWFAELHLAAQSVAPDAGDEERLTGLARLAQFIPLGEETTLGVGLSAAVREEAGGGRRDLAGADLYLRWRPPETRTAVTLQGEWFGRRFRGVEGGSDQGWYAQAMWRGGAHWGLGARWDEAPADPAAGQGDERRLSGLAAWYLSEFQRLRLQVSHDARPGGAEGWEALLHLEFGIGAHGAHPF